MDFFSHVWAAIRNTPLVKRRIVLDVVQGILVGAGLAILTAILARQRDFERDD